MRVFVFEFVCAGGLGTHVPASLLREGHAMLAAVVADFQNLADVHVTTLIARDYSYHLGDDCRLTSSERLEFEEFEDIAAECDWTLVIAPEFDDYLADYSSLVDPGCLLGSEPTAIRLTGDKLALAEYWRLHRVPHPWTDAFEHADLASIPPPWVLKPRYGAGSQSIFLVENAEAARKIAQAELQESADSFIVQRYLRGQAASVALLIGKRQAVALAPCTQRLSADGRFRYLGGSLPMPAPLAERATKLALQAVANIDGLRGYVGVDLVLGDDGVDYAIEINPRLTTSYLGLRQLCNQNLAELLLQAARGERIEPPTWKEGEVLFQA